MDEKKTIKISLSTFFLILAILVIIVMGFFLYNLNSKNVSMSAYQTELNSKIANLENEVSISKTEKTEINANKNTVNSNTEENTIPMNTASSSSTKSLTYSSLKGTYEGTATSYDETGTVYLTLRENGMYLYENVIGLSCASEGYYTFDDNTLILHQLVSRGNDPGVHIEGKTINLKINDDNSITDNALNAVLKKSSDTLLREEVDICNTLKRALTNGFLD